MSFHRVGRHNVCKNLYLFSVFIIIIISVKPYEMNVLK